MKTGVDRGYRDRAEPVYCPAGRFFSFGRKEYRGGKQVRAWRFDVLGFLFDRGSGILRGYFAWDPDVIPSYARALRAIWNNVCMWLTPFYRPRRALLNALINDNGTKLLWFDRKSAYMRNRGPDCVYCRIRCGFRDMTVTLERYVDEETKSGVCVFLRGTDGTCKEERVVAAGPCLTWKQCERLYAEVVKATPELDWYTNGD